MVCFTRGKKLTHGIAILFILLDLNIKLRPVMKSGYDGQCTMEEMYEPTTPSKNIVNVLIIKAMLFPVFFVYVLFKLGMRTGFYRVTLQNLKISRVPRKP